MVSPTVLSLAKDLADLIERVEALEESVAARALWESRLESIEAQLGMRPPYRPGDQR